MEKENKVREHLDRKIFENSFSMLLLFDEKGRVYEWNPMAKEELGYQEEDGPIYIEQIFPKDFEKEEGKLKQIPHKGSDSFAYRHNHTCFPVEILIDMGKLDGRFYGYCIAENVTRFISAMKDIRKAKDEAQTAAKTRGELVSNVTHELRTPMNGIQGIANQLLETSLNEEQREMLATINRCCNNMNKIINDLLDFAKLNHANFMLEKKPFLFREFMKRTVEMNLPMIQEKGLSFRVNIAPDVPDRLVGDEFRMSQILNNLLSNSVKFTKIGGIEVNVTKTMDLEGRKIELFFMVMDTGIGIEEKNLDKLFQSFSQVDASITRRYGGTGLGLSITKQLVELMDGEIFVESEYKKGSTFSFSIRIECQEYDAYKRDAFDNKSTYQEFLSGEDREKRDSNEGICRFGSRACFKQLRDTMSKLILCMEMDNWEKAEELAEIVKALVGEDAQEKDIKQVAFRMLLSIRKGSKENALHQYQILQEQMNKRWTAEMGP